MNILLLHAKKRVLPERVRNALRLECLTVITEPGYVQEYGDDVDVYLVESIQNLDEVRHAFTGILAKRDIEAVFAPFELGQQAAGYLRSHFGLSGPGFDTVSAFSNKYVMKQRLAAANLPVTGFRLAYGLAKVPSVAEELGWPVVVKPMIGGGSFDVHTLMNPGHFAQFSPSPAAQNLDTLPVPLVVEQFVHMRDEYHLDAIVRGGEVVFATASRYLVPVLERSTMFGSCTLPAGHPTAEHMAAMHARTVRVFGLEDGVTHMEFLETSDGSLLVGEIACRPAGGGIPEAIRLHTGIDLWRAAVDLARRHPVNATAQIEDGVIAHCYLPVRTGRITGQTSAEELQSLPSVVHVEMLRTTGDLIRGPLSSAEASALVYVRVPRPEEAELAVRRVYDAYEVEIVPERSDPTRLATHTMQGH